MKTEKVIYRSLPTRNILGVLILLGIAVFAVVISDDFIVKVLFVVLFTMLIVYNWLTNYFAHGIIIYEDKLEIIQRNFKGIVIVKPVEFSEVKQLDWNKGGLKQERVICLKIFDRKKFKVAIKEDAFEFGNVLKFLAGKGIKIVLIHSDEELNRFIKGELKEFPMKNEEIE